MDQERLSMATDGRNSSQARPTSAQTRSSTFTDSAVDMDTTTISSTKSAVSEDDAVPSAQSLSPISQSISDRLRRLAASAWALEQDDDMSQVKRWQVDDKLKELEVILESHDLADVKPTGTQPVYLEAGQQRNQDSRDLTAEEKEELDKLSILQVHDNLREVVTAMRLRQQEQRHLHQLTVNKIESVAQRCILQEQQMRNMANEVESLRHENRILGQDNDRLQDAVIEMESEACKKEVAVTAMTSAVAGLEGWIDEADKARTSRLGTPPPARESHQRRAVVRGKGRFRGRYYVDEEHAAYLAEHADARELEDGVRAWIRGFRDVEDACSSPGRGHPGGPHKDLSEADEDDWGPFEGSADVVL